MRHARELLAIVDKTGLFKHLAKLHPLLRVAWSETIFKDTPVSQSKRILEMCCLIIEVVTSILLSI